MEKLDRLGWAAGIAFDCYGLRLGVRIDDPQLLPRIVELLPWGWRPADRLDVEHLFSFRFGRRDGRRYGRAFHLGYSDAERVVRSDDLKAALHAFENHLHLLVAEMSRTHVFVHAGAVAQKGRAVLLPGRSMWGKSTLVAALVDAGATFYSDEYALLDGDGSVHPYLARLKLRGEHDTPLRFDLGAGEPPPPVPVGLVVITRYAQEIRRWQPRRLTPGQGLLEMLAHTVPARRQPERVLDVLGAVVTEAEVLKGRRPDAREVAARILARLEA